MGVVLGGAAIVFFAFIGFDAVSTAKTGSCKKSETRYADRILGSLVVCTVLYILFGHVNRCCPMAGFCWSAKRRWSSLWRMPSAITCRGYQWLFNSCYHRDPCRILIGDPGDNWARAACFIQWVQTDLFQKYSAFCTRVFKHLIAQTGFCLYL